MTHQKFMKMAIQLALENVGQNLGGPFGAVIVQNGDVIGQGQNRVTYQQDPTAHAEVQAIRNACKKVGHFELEGAVIYTSCEPCPMCLAAIYWSRLDGIYFATTKKEAAAAGFDDDYIYQEIAKPIEMRNVPMNELFLSGRLTPFQRWMQSENRIDY